MPAADPYALLTAAVAADPARPLLTFYDDATGERVELSGATFANWVAKTANLLRDELAVAPGDRVAVDLPLHWQAAVVLLACWAVGAELALGPLPGADVAVVAGEALDPPPPAGEVLALSLAPLGGGLPAPVAGVHDFAAEVLAHGDRFVAETPSGRAVAERAAERAVALGLTSTDRVLAAGTVADAEAVVDCLLAPWAAGASVVLCRNADAARLADRVRAERVTATIGVTVAGVRAATG